MMLSRSEGSNGQITKTLASLMAVANEISRHIAKAITVAQAFEEIQEGAPVSHIDLASFNYDP